MKCDGCGIEKDPEKQVPLFKLEVQDRDVMKLAHVCHECFHKLDPDMWISRHGWESIKPVVPFDQLPTFSNARFVDHATAQGAA